MLVNPLGNVGFPNPFCDSRVSFEGSHKSISILNDGYTVDKTSFSNGLNGLRNKESLRNVDGLEQKYRL